VLDLRELPPLRGMFMVSDGCLGHDFAVALQVTPWVSDRVRNTHLPMQMDRSLFPRDHVWDQLTLVNPFGPGPRFLLPCTMVNHQYPSAYLYEPPYSGSAAFLEQEDFHTTRALMYARLHLPTCCDSTEQLQRVLSRMPKEKFRPTPAERDMLQRRFTQLLSSHPRPLPHGVPKKVTHLRHYPFMLQDSAMYGGTVEEHLEMLI
jgi:hypothetical protein